MTGYGSSKVLSDGRELTVEIKSVNHRFFDCSCRLPRNLGFLEENARRLLGERLARGHIDVYINYVNHREDARTIQADIPLAMAYQRALAELSGALDIVNQTTLRDIAEYPGVLTVAEAEDDSEAIRTMAVAAISEAAEQLLQMRGAEGKRLYADFLQKLEAIDALRDRIAQLAPTVVATYKERLSDRLTRLLNGELDEARFATEVAIFADRSAIDEELTRLDSHITQIRDALQLDEPIGRKLDFLIQELNREFNTIGSKALDSGIVECVVAAKSEIEKLREQVQNIE